MPSIATKSRSRGSTGAGRSRKQARRNAAAGGRLTELFTSGKVDFAVFCAFVALVGFTGGGSRPDIVSLLILRPLAALFAIYLIWRMTGEHFDRVRGPIYFMTALMGLALLQLVPLPPAIWSALPGREDIATLDGLLGMEGLWRPLSLEPNRTWNAFFSMFVPLVSVGFVGLLWKRERRRILYPILAVAILSMVIGYLQAIGGNGLHFYRVTHDNHPVGLFANKNHQAVLLNWVLLTACYLVGQIDPRARRASLHLTAALAVIGLVFPLLFVTGSRAGLLLSAPISLVCIILLWNAPVLNKTWKGARGRFKLAMAGGAVGVLMALILVFAYLALTDRQTALTRLFEADTADELRWIYFPKLLQMAGEHWLEGIGFGAFESVFYGYEDVGGLTTAYLNQAHLEPVQFVIEAGLPGAVIAVAAIVWLCRKLLILWRDADPAYSRMGIYLSAAITVWLVAGLVDYPLRTPIAQMIFAILTAISAASTMNFEKKRRHGG